MLKIDTTDGSFGIDAGCGNATRVVTKGEWQVLSLVVAGSGAAPGNVQIFRNSLSQAVTTQGLGWASAGNYLTAAAVATVGARSVAGFEVLDSYLFSTLGDVIVVNGTLGSYDRVRTEVALMQKYGVTTPPTLVQSPAPPSPPPSTAPAPPSPPPVNLDGLYSWYFAGAVRAAFLCWWRTQQTSGYSPPPLGLRPHDDSALCRFVRCLGSQATSPSDFINDLRRGQEAERAHVCTRERADPPS